MKSSRRHDLKHDQLADTLGSIWEYIVFHRAKVVVISVGVLAAAGLISWIFAAGALARSAAEDRLAEVQNTIWQIEQMRRQDPEQAMMLSGRAIADLRDIAQEFSRTPAAAQALFKAGRLLFEEGQYDRAAQTFREVIADTANRPVLLQMARRNLAAALEEDGRPADALEEYRRLAQDADSSLARAQAHWDMGRCYEEMGEPDRAEEAYAEAARHAPDSAWAELALSRRSALKGDDEPPPDAREPLTTDPPDDMTTPPGFEDLLPPMHEEPVEPSEEEDDPPGDEEEPEAEAD